MVLLMKFLWVHESSQRYLEIYAFEVHKNDGGVPYKTKEDLRRFISTRRGNQLNRMRMSIN